MVNRNIPIIERKFREILPDVPHRETGLLRNNHKLLDRHLHSITLHTESRAKRS